MDLPVIELHGTPSQMGEAFGEACRAEARELYDIRMRCALRCAADNGRSLSEAQDGITACSGRFESTETAERCRKSVHRLNRNAPCA